MYLIEEVIIFIICCLEYIWVGLCLFVVDGDLVVGYVVDVEGFFWVVVQGGYGIQILVVMGEVSVVLICYQLLLVYLCEYGLDEVMLLLCCLFF